LDASEQFSLLFGCLLVAYIEIVFTYKLNIFDCGSDFARKFGLDVVVLIGFVDLYVENRWFAWLVADRSFLHLNYNQNYSFCCRISSEI